MAALAGGVGAAKMLAGLARVMDPADLTVIANTGDDIVLHGLHISPDPDIVTYTLAGVVNPDTGWGWRDETFHALDGLKTYGRESWFHLGDRDLATHIHRTAMLRDGATLSEAADSIRRALGVAARILPMSDDRVPTMLDTDAGRLHLQEYLVEHRAATAVRAVTFTDVEKSAPAPGIIPALEQADAIVICPSNPLISIGPILAVPGIRAVLAKRRTDVLAICPLVGGRSLKGPSDKMMAQLGHEVSPRGVAGLYADICDTMMLDPADESAAPDLETLAIKALVRPTIMRSEADKDDLARAVLAWGKTR